MIVNTSQLHWIVYFIYREVSYINHSPCHLISPCKYPSICSSPSACIAKVFDRQLQSHFGIITPPIPYSRIIQALDDLISYICPIRSPSHYVDPLDLIIPNPNRAFSRNTYNLSYGHLLLNGHHDSLIRQCMFIYYISVNELIFAKTNLFSNIPYSYNLFRADFK